LNGSLCQTLGQNMNEPRIIETGQSRDYCYPV
jgi:hypothetical protein